MLCVIKCKIFATVLFRKTETRIWCKLLRINSIHYNVDTYKAQNTWTLWAQGQNTYCRMSSFFSKESPRLKLVLMKQSRKLVLYTWKSYRNWLAAKKRSKMCPKCRDSNIPACVGAICHDREVGDIHFKWLFILFSSSKTDTAGSVIRIWM